MTLRIGRAVIPHGPHDISHNGDDLTINLDMSRGTFAAPDTTALLALRQQLLGLVDNADEPVVPVAWDYDPQIDGYYRPTAVNVTPGKAHADTGRLQATVSLRRLGGGWAKALFEIPVQAAVYPNDHSITGRASLALPNPPSSIWSVERDFGGFGGQQANISVEGGSVTSAVTSSLPISTVVSYYLPPSIFYLAAATIEVEVGGVWRPVVGRQLPMITPGRWRLSNGSLRLTPLDVGGNKFCFVELWGGLLGWLSLFEFRPMTSPSNPIGFGQVATTGSSTDFVQPVIVRNSPERCTLLLPASNGWAQWITVRRGERHATFAINTRNTSAQFGITSRTPVACTDGGSHMRRTTPVGGAGGPQFFVSTPRTNTVDTTNAFINVDVAAPRTIFGIGQYFVTENQSEVEESLTAHAEVQQAVVR